jgi:hypothetical protein
MPKYIIVLETEKPLDWVTSLLQEVKQKYNDSSYRGFGFVPPIKKLEVKKAK